MKTEKNIYASIYVFRSTPSGLGMTLQKSALLAVHPTTTRNLGYHLSQTGDYVGSSTSLAPASTTTASGSHAHHLATATTCFDITATDTTRQRQRVITTATRIQHAEQDNTSQFTVHTITRMHHAASATATFSTYAWVSSETCSTRAAQRPPSGPRPRLRFFVVVV